MKIHCFKCGKKITPSISNVNIIGPDILFKCPFCNYRYEGKFTSFLRDQLGGYESQSVSAARHLQALAQFVELNSSDYYEKRGLRHGKIRNIRDRRKSEAEGS